MTAVGMSDKTKAPITVDNKNFSFVFFLRLLSFLLCT